MYEHCCVVVAGNPASQPSVVMTKPSYAEKAARTVAAILSRIKGANAQLDADLTSTLPAVELWSVYKLLQPVFDLSNGLMDRRALKLDEALVYVRDTRLCELLLSLLRRLPWSDMHSDANSRQGLALLPGLLGSLGTLFEATARMRSSQQAAACAELSKWCQPRGRAPPPCCADCSCQVEACECTLAALPVPAQHGTRLRAGKKCGCTRC